METNLNISMDENVKQDFEEICGKLGLSTDDAFTLFAKTVVQQRGIPFPVTLDTPNAETLAAIEEVNKGFNLKGPFSGVEALMRDLNAED